jgi:hypothetical protein
MDINLECIYSSDDKLLTALKYAMVGNFIDRGAMDNVIENGTDIPGTQLDEINIKSKAVIDNADLILAKGQGNFETLFGCDKNIYYIFLCKCDLFTKRFNIEKFKGVFVN